MISEPGFEAIRIAATLNHLYPALSTQVRDGERLLVEVAWPPALNATEGALQVHPCSFRQCVAAAWAEHQAGREMTFLGLGTDVSVDLRAAVGGRVWPCGIVRLPLFDRFVYAFGATIDPESGQTLGADLLDDFDPPPGTLGLRIQGDVDTRITVVSVDVDPDPRHPGEPAVLGLLHALVARFAATDLIAGLTDEGGPG